MSQCLDKWESTSRWAMQPCYVTVTFCQLLVQFLCCLPAHRPPLPDDNLFICIYTMRSHCCFSLMIFVLPTSSVFIWWVVFFSVDLYSSIDQFSVCQLVGHHSSVFVHGASGHVLLVSMASQWGPKSLKQTEDLINCVHNAKWPKPQPPHPHQITSSPT